MARYSIFDRETGQRVVVEGDSAPTEIEAQDIFNSLPPPDASGLTFKQALKAGATGVAEAYGPAAKKVFDFVAPAFSGDAGAVGVGEVYRPEFTPEMMARGDNVPLKEEAKEAVATALQIAPGPIVGAATAMTGYGIPAAAGMAGAAAAAGDALARGIRGTPTKATDPAAWGAVQAAGMAIPAMGRLTTPMFAARQPAAAITAEIAGAAAQGVATGTVLDAVYQDFTEGKIDWERAFTVGGMSGVLAGIGGAVRAAEVGRLASIDRQGILLSAFERARQMGYKGPNTVDGIKGWMAQQQPASGQQAAPPQSPQIAGAPPRPVVNVTPQPQAPVPPPAPTASPAVPTPQAALVPQRPPVAPPPAAEARPAIVAPATPDFSKATTKEVDDWAESVRKFDKDSDVAVFGEERAREYRRLQRIANSTSRSASDPALKKADDEIAKMEDSLTPEQQDVLFGRNLPDGFIDVDEAKRLRNLAVEIDSSESGKELADASSLLIQGALRASSSGENLSAREAEMMGRVMRRAGELDVKPQELVALSFQRRAKTEGADVLELAGTTPEQFENFIKGMAKPDTVKLPAGAQEVAQVEAVNIGPRDATISTGTGVATPAEHAMLAEQKRLIEEYQAGQAGQTAPATQEAATATPKVAEIDTIVSSPATAAQDATTGSPVFTREEIAVGKPSITRRKRATGTDGEVAVEVNAPGKITEPANWSRLSDNSKTRATVTGRLVFDTGKQPSKTEAVWSVYKGRPKAGGLIAQGLTYDQAIERAKDFVESANPLASSKSKFTGISSIGMPPLPPGTPSAMQGGGRMEASLPRVAPGSGRIDKDTVLKSLENVLRVVGSQTPIRSGRIAQRNAAGIFKSWEEVIRTRAYGNIPTAAHEVAHALSKVVFGSPMSKPLMDAVGFTPVIKELQALGKALYGDTKPTAGYTAEGFAELVRLWLSTEDAHKKAPLASKWFENAFLQDKPQLRAALEKARDDIDLWRGQGAIDRAEAQRVHPPGKLERLVKFIKSNATKGTVLERFAPLEELTKGYEKISGSKLPIDQDPNILAQAFRRTAGETLRYWAEYGMTDRWGNVTGPSLREAYGQLKPKDADRFHAFLFAKEALVRHGQGKDPGMERSDAEFIVNELGSPEFTDAATKIAQWWDGVLEYKLQAYPEMNGPMIEAIREANPAYYGPLSRAIDPEQARRSSVREAGTGMQRFQGSGRPIKDIYLQSLLQAENMIGSAQRDMALRAAVQLGKHEGMGFLIEKVPVQRVIERVNIEKLRAALDDYGVDTSQVPADSLINYATQLDQPTGVDPIIAVKENGITQWYQVPRQLQESLQGIHEPARLNALFELTVGMPTRLFKLGTTGLRPAFSLVTNPARDVVTFMAQSLEDNPAKKVAALTNAFAETVAYAFAGYRSPYIDAFQRLGIGVANFVGGDIAQAKREAKGMFHGKLFRLWSSPVENLREFLSFPETMFRVAELRLVGNQVGWEPGTPMTPAQSVAMRLAAKRVTTDFSAAGSAPSELRRGLAGPFYNAILQSLRAFGRAFGTEQDIKKKNYAAFKAVLNGLTLITLPTLYNWWRNKDEEWFKMLPWREKYFYTFTKLNDGTVIQVPLPHEWGVLFGSLVMSAFDSWYRDDPEAVKKAVGFALEQTNPTDLPVLAKLAKEQWQNELDFFQRPIVPRGEVDLLPGEQQGPYTSWLAKSLGSAFPEQISPRRMDAAIRQVFGGLGSDVVDAPSSFMQALGLNVNPDQREWEPSDMFILGRAFRRGGDISANNQYLLDFWDDLNRYSAWKQSQNAALKAGRPPASEMSGEDLVYAKMLEGWAPYLNMTMKIAGRTTSNSARRALYADAARQAKNVTDMKPKRKGMIK